MNPLVMAAIQVALQGFIRQQFGVTLPADAGAFLAARGLELAQVAVDWKLDGDGHLSAEHLNVLNALVIDSRRGEL